MKCNTALLVAGYKVYLFRNPEATDRAVLEVKVCKLKSRNALVQGKMPTKLGLYFLHICIDEKFSVAKMAIGRVHVNKHDHFEATLLEEQRGFL